MLSALRLKSWLASRPGLRRAGSVANPITRHASAKCGNPPNNCGTLLDAHLALYSAVLPSPTFPLIEVAVYRSIRPDACPSA